MAATSGFPMIYYFARSDRPGEVKIGLSTNVPTRALNLRGGKRDGHTATLLGVEPGDRTVERMRHAEFAAMRLDGEWFTYGAPIIHHVMQLDQTPVEASYDTHWMPVAA